MVNGLFVGKFLPPHKGHKFAILEAKKKCDKLYLVIGYEPNVTKKLCSDANIPYITLEQKINWWKKELKNEKDIIILGEDETGIPSYPEGWKMWAERTQKIVGENIDIIFGSELGYAPYYKQYFPDSEYCLQDVNRVNYNISSTIIRKNVKENLNWIIDSARPFFEDYYKNKN